jgi:hypothetical protein
VTGGAGDGKDEQGQADPQQIGDDDVVGVLFLRRRLNPKLRKAKTIIKMDPITSTAQMGIRETFITGTPSRFLGGPP